ncbi:hypothetical protein IIB34_06010, partial [PVC group bacterium]|nr:hypothetical protein [PVC group bacterium]
WTHDGHIKYSLDSMGRIARVDSAHFKDEVWPHLKEFFEIHENTNGEWLTHPRLTKELGESKLRRFIAQRNGKKGGRPRTQKEPIGLPDGNPDHNPEKTSSPSPSHYYLKGKKEKEKILKKEKYCEKEKETLRETIRKEKDEN